MNHDKTTVNTTTDHEEKRYAQLQSSALDCARSGENDMLEAMLRAGMPVNLADHKGNSLLMLAAYHSHTATVQLLLEYGADPDRRNDRNQTPLGGVAFKGDTATARVLLAGGADVNADQGGGKTPLMFATLFGRRSMVELLTRRGAEQNRVMGLPPGRLVGLTAVMASLVGRLSRLFRSRHR